MIAKVRSQNEILKLQSMTGLGVVTHDTLNEYRALSEEERKDGNVHLVLESEPIDANVVRYNNENSVKDMLDSMVGYDDTVTTMAQYNQLTPAEKNDGRIRVIGDAGGALHAAGVSYDNTTSGLEATDTQAAIDELDTHLSDKQDKDWEQVDIRSATQTISFPSEWNEILVTVYSPTSRRGAGFSIKLTPTMIEKHDIFATGYYTNSTSNGSCLIDTANGISVSSVSVNGNDVKSTFSLLVEKR